MHSIMYFARCTLRRLLPATLALALRRQWLSRQVAAERGRRETDLDVLPGFVQAGDVCWDVGASSGTYTLALSRLGARVTAFEPVPHSFDILVAVTRRSRLQDVALERIALSDYRGTGRMSVPTCDFYRGYYLATLDDGGDLTVEVSTVDHLIQQGRPKPAFIKVDVEGAEVRVVQGARSLIARHHPVWLIETFGDELIPLMRSSGYRAYLRIAPGTLVETSARTVGQPNYWFFPEGDARPRRRQ